jgi:hypothetical protein
MREVTKIDYRESAIEAAQCYRALDATLQEFERILPENPNWYNIIERFVNLHKDFYTHIVNLTSEESWIIDREFMEEVKDEEQKLREMLKYIQREKWFLEKMIWSAWRRTEYWSTFFATCVEDIFEWYAIDSETNEIFFVLDENNPL